MSRHETFRFREAADLRLKVAELGLDLPWADDPGLLLRETQAAGRRLRNALAVQPMEGADAEADGSPGPLTVRRYERFARGGAGLIWFEAAAVVPDGRSNPRQLRIHKKNLDAFTALVEAARNAAPAGSSPLLILQLTHSGRMSRPDGSPRPVIARHAPELDALHGLKPDHPILSDRDLDRLQYDFAEAALLAGRAGFDGVDIKACHGYLAAELLGARDRPDSRYGGPLENRARFLVETAGKIRRAAPRLVLACRLGVADFLPGGFGVHPADRGRADLAEPHDVIRRLTEQGLTLLNVSAGLPALLPHISRPFDHPAAGGRTPDEHPLEGVSRLVRLADETQKAFPGLAVVGTGYSWLRQFFPQVAAGVLLRRGASIIGLGRLAFADPDFPEDIRRFGGLPSRKTCTACSACSTLLRAGVPAGCVVRDASVYRTLGR